MKNTKTTISAVIFVLTICLTSVFAQADGSASTHHGRRLLKFDVAENATRFVPDEAPVHEGTTPPMPAYGNAFITEGYIYPYGTIQCNDAGECSGTTSDGAPQFPEKVIGRWTCRGWFVGDGMLTQTGPVVISTQLYDLDSVPGNKTIASEGYELIDFNTVIKRAITGGTGEYLAARGQAEQSLMGFNETMGVSLRFKLKVIKR